MKATSIKNQQKTLAGIFTSINGDISFGSSLKVENKRKHKARATAGSRKKI